MRVFLTVLTSFLIYFPVFAATPNSVIWPVRQSWSWEWEQRYGEWVSKELDAEFFNRYRVQTDCADVAIAARWIFARINGLPAANTRWDTGGLFTQESMRTEWKKLPRSENWWQDQVFLAALEFVLVKTDTQSLWGDSYPVEIKPETFLAGTHHMEFKSFDEMGHTQLVNYVDLSQQSAEIGILESTVPRGYRVLFAIALDQAEQPKPTHGGLLRLRWPEKKGSRWILRAPAQHQTYSMEQYRPDFVSGGDAGFSVAVKKRLASVYDPLKDFQTAVGNMRTLLKKRVGIVEQGFAVCQKVDCRPETSAWNEWSTPDRDSRLYDLDRLLQNMREQNLANPGFEQFWNEFLVQQELVIDGELMSYESIMIQVSSNNLSPEPRDSIRKRWGLP